MSYYLTVSEFGGVDKNSQGLVALGEGGTNVSGATQVRACDNFVGKPDYASAERLAGPVGFLSKCPPYSNYKGVMADSGRVRGMHEHYEDVAWNGYLMWLGYSGGYGTANGRLRAYRYIASTWLNLAVQVPYSAYTFASYGAWCYMSGAGIAYKWQYYTGSWSAYVAILQDKGGTAIAIAGATLTWNATTTVTSDIDISGTVVAGNYIRRSNTSTTWDHVKAVDGAGTTITLSETSTDVGASAAGGAERSPDAYNEGHVGNFIIAWKDRLWLTTTAGLVTASVPNDLEDFSSTALGAWSGQIGEYTFNEYTAGVESLGDYLFFFKDFSFYVYRYSSVLTAPLAYINKFDYGCQSYKTIKKVKNGIMYFAGNDLRWTNGSEDVSVSEKIKTLIQSLFTFKRGRYYYASGAADNAFPFAVLETRKNLYKLCFPNYASSLTYIINYDYETGQFAGTELRKDYGDGLEVHYQEQRADLVVSPIAAESNQLLAEDFEGGDVAVAGQIESMTFHSGHPNKLIKIKWIKFDFHPITGCNSTITFNYRPNLDAVSAGNAQTYALAYAGANAQEVDTSVKFMVNSEELKYFSWVLTDANNGGTDSFGIVSWTMCYDIVDTA